MTSPQSGEERLSAAANLLNANRLAEAEDVLQKLVIDHAGSGTAWFLLGMVCGRQKRNQDALRALLKAEALGTQQPALPSLLGLLCFRVGRFDQAVAYYRAALKQAPADTGIAVQLADVLMNTGVLDEAEALFTLVRKAKPDDVAANVGLALILATKGRDEEALAHIAAAHRAAPQSELVRAWSQDLPLLARLRTLFTLSTEGPLPSPYTDMLRTALASFGGEQPVVMLYHVDQEGPHPFQSLQQNAEIDYLGITRIAVEAARKHWHGCRVVMITDPHSPMPLGDRVDAVVRLPVRREWIMYERLRVQRALAACGRFSGPMLFIDTDIVLNRDFSALFQHDFDVALSWRINPLMPINGGMIVGRAGANLVRFFDRNIALYEALADCDFVRDRYGFDVRAFRGGQLAHGAYVGWDCPLGRPARRAIDDVDVAFFAADDINFTYASETDPEVLASKLAIHFKGGPAKAHAQPMQGH